MTHLRPCGSLSTAARLLGLALAREAQRLLAWDEGRSLYLWDLEGRLHARAVLLTAPACAAISDDGSQVLVADREGGLTWLNHQLELRFNQELPVRSGVVGLALEALGRYAVVSTADQLSFLLTRTGNLVAKTEMPRPLKHLAFVPGQRCFIGAADFGLVTCIDSVGKVLWRDTPVSHVGAVGVSGAGPKVWLACFSSGLQGYDRSGKNLGTLTTSRPCCLVCVDWAGERILVADDAGTLSLLKPDGQVLGELPTNRAVTALVLGALGDLGACGHADGTVTLLEL